MTMYRIICTNGKDLAFAEIVPAPLRVINESVYYTDRKGRSWKASPYEFIRSRFVEDPEIIREAIAKSVVQIRLGSGRPVPSPVPIPAYWYDILNK